MGRRDEPKKEEFSFQAEFRENICKLGLAGMENKTLFQNFLPPRVFKVRNGLSVLPAKCDLSQYQVEGVSVRPVLKLHSPQKRGLVSKRCVNDFCQLKWIVTIYRKPTTF